MHREILRRGGASGCERDHEALRRLQHMMYPRSARDHCKHILSAPPSPIWIIGFSLEMLFVPMLHLGAKKH